MKQLKQRLLLSMLLLLVVTGIGLTACSADDMEGLQEEGTQRFSISVTDGGYTSTRDGIHTKAVENGYTTEFTAGDKIGVFAVKGGAILTEVNNQCLTATDNGGTLEWKDASGNAPLKFSGAAYYAYYPYQSTPAGTTDASATDAADFFADFISNWSPNADQGTYAKYTAQDLMVVNGIISNNELSFPMQHQMRLVVIELPGTKYEFSNTSPPVSDYITDPLNTGFDGYSPCRMKDGCYRYLVNPSTTSNLTGSYTNASGAAKGWEINPAGISSGNYQLFKVDGGIATVVNNYTLQAGDYMLKDGTLVSKDETLTAAQQANCRGIVFWVGNPTEGNHNNGTIFTDFGDPALKNEKSQCTHGLVVALQDASSSMKWQNSTSDVGAWVSSNTPYQNIATNYGAEQALNKLRGYNNTQAIRAYNNTHSGNIVLAVQSIDSWAASNTAPTNSSGWYFPSEKELTLLCGQDVNNIWSNDSGGTGMRDIVNASLGNIGSPATTIAYAFYWSSSENALYSDNAFYVYFDRGGVSFNYKFFVYRVRAVLAF